MRTALRRRGFEAALALGVLACGPASTAVGATAEIAPGFPGWDTPRLRQARDRGEGVTIERVPLAPGVIVDLQLQPFSVTGPGSRFVLGRRGGADRPLEFDPSRVLLFRGEVAGRPGSHVFLALDGGSATGEIDLGPGGGRYRLSSGARRGRSPGAGSRLSVFEAAGPVTPPPGVPLCGVESATPPPPLPLAPVPSAAVSAAGPKQLQLAVETDHEFYVLFGDAADAAAYLVQLYGAVSDIYQRDVDTRVELVYARIWDDPDDLFNDVDPSPLGDFRNYWNANMGAVTRDAAQLLSGRRDYPFGGQAYLSALCSSTAYSVVGYALGFFPDPDEPSIYSYDVSVTAHELGHNSGTGHTHDAPNFIDTCNDPLTSPQRGTIMSYCGQTWSGGNSNRDNLFHTRVRQNIEAHVGGAACVVDDCNLNGVADALDILGGGSLDANGSGIPDECEDCNGNAVLDDEDIALGTSPDLDGNAVPDECQPDCNANGVPDGKDIADGTSFDLYGNGVPDECEADCDSDATSDYSEIQADMTLDLDRDRVLDACQDCDGDGTIDLEELGGAHRAWVGSGLAGEPIREFHPAVGVRTRVSTGATVDGAADLIATPDGRLLVSSAGDDRVLAFDQAGGYLGALVTAAGGLDGPAGLLLTPAGELLVASSGTDSVLAFDATSGAPAGAFVAPGAGGLTAPFGLARGPNGNLFVTSGDPAGSAFEVLEFDGEDGSFVRVFVDAAASGGLDRPRGLAFKPDGNLLVASFGSNEVLEYDGATGASLGKWAQVGTATVLTQVSPWGIRVGPNGNVYVSRTGEAYGSGGASDDDAHTHLHVDALGDAGAGLHLTNAQIYEYDVRNGNFLRTYIGGNDHGLLFPTGFDFVPGWSVDCNLNSLPDDCDVAGGGSADADSDGVPDECEVDCDANGVADRLDLIPFGSAFDCNFNGSPDTCDLAALTSRDCDANGVPDECDVRDPVETAAGWTVGGPGDTASAGVWVHGDPVGTAAQPEDDHTPAGAQCFVTGQGSPGGAVGEADVDGGATTLRSPVFDLAGDPDAEIGYWRWFSNDAGSNPGQDVLTVDVSDDAGQSWVNVEVVGPSSPETSGGWFFHGFRVADLVDPAGDVVLRFVAADTGGGSIVEAAVDDLVVVAACCDADPDCDDGLSCTSDACGLEAGVCAAVVDPGACAIDGACYADGETNPADDCQRCAAATPVAWSAAGPVEVEAVAVAQAGDTQLAWSGQGPGTVYDVAGGEVSELAPAGGVADALCLADDVAGTTWTDLRADPAAGAAYYYLVRSQKSCGAGGYGSASAGGPRQPASACP